MAFTSWDLLTAPRWVGLDNFGLILGGDPLVLHAEHMPMLEAEMYGYPRAANDDAADAAVAGLERFLAPPKLARVGARVGTYT